MTKLINSGYIDKNKRNIPLNSTLQHVDDGRICIITKEYCPASNGDEIILTIIKNNKDNMQLRAKKLFECDNWIRNFIIIKLPGNHKLEECTYGERVYVRNN